MVINAHFRDFRTFTSWHCFFLSCQSSMSMSLMGTGSDSQIKWLRNKKFELCFFSTDWVLSIDSMGTGQYTKIKSFVHEFKFALTLKSVIKLYHVESYRITFFGKIPNWNWKMFFEKSLFLSVLMPFWGFSTVSSEIIV